jgi:TolA-binding protein
VYFELYTSLLRSGKAYAPDSASRFLRANPGPVYASLISLEIARYHFRSQQYALAIPFYEQAGISNLTNQSIADARFELAYSYFTIKKYQEAIGIFRSMKDASGGYGKQGIYYYALLAYYQGDYNEALQNFKQVEHEPAYQDLVPYYIAEIYYFTAQPDLALQTARDLMARSQKIYYDKELNLLAAQILYERKIYAEALPYFRNYYERSSSIRKEELYEMAHCYYSLKNWAEAIPLFKQLNETDDSLGQSAMYLLGDTYLKSSDKRSARSAFGLAAAMSHNAPMQEASLLLHAQLCYEQGYYSDAITSLTNLLLTYPNAASVPEARTMLAGLYYQTKKYRQAYALLLQARAQSPSYKLLFQKISYALGITAFKDGNLRRADSFLTASLLFPRDSELAATTQFWLGESAMERKAHSAAITHFTKFQAFAGRHASASFALSGATIRRAAFSMGIASMQLGKYEDAKNFFAQISDGPDDQSPDVEANLRKADALFMLKDYQAALESYKKVELSGGPDAPYASMQRAVILGLTNNNAEKLKALQRLISMGDSSAYAAQARYEAGITLIEESKYADAIAMLQPLTTSTGDWSQKSLLRIGFAYQQNNNDAKAIEAYRKSILDYPSNTIGRAAALDALKNLYIERNEPGAYELLLRELNGGGAQVNVDSAYYEAAEARYAAEDYPGASAAFSTYLLLYPEGAAATQAFYYRAEAHALLKQYDQALSDYDSVVRLPWSSLSDISARKGINIASQTKAYPQLFTFSQALRRAGFAQEDVRFAYTGMMMAKYAMDSLAEAALIADTLVGLSPDSNTLAQITFIRARAYQQAGRDTEAYAAYQSITTPIPAAMEAERGYRMAQILLKSGQIKQAEDAAAATLPVAEGDEYWKIKIYLLLSDILIAQKDYFNARATLKSVLDNTSDPALKADAQTKLSQVIKAERASKKINQKG